MNGTAVKEAAAVAYPREKMIGVWWSGAEPDVTPAGDQAAGYKSLGDPLLAVGDPVLFPFWMAETGWANANRAVIKKWIASLEEALGMIKSDDAMAREVLAKYTNLPAAVVARIPYPAYQFSIKPEQLAVWKNVLVQQGKPVTAVDVNALVVTD